MRAVSYLRVPRPPSSRQKRTSLVYRLTVIGISVIAIWLSVIAAAVVIAADVVAREGPCLRRFDFARAMNT